MRKLCLPYFMRFVLISTSPPKRSACPQVGAHKLLVSTTVRVFCNDFRHANSRHSWRTTPKLARHSWRSGSRSLMESMEAAHHLPNSFDHLAGASHCRGHARPLARFQNAPVALGHVGPRPTRSGERNAKDGEEGEEGEDDDIRPADRVTVPVERERRALVLPGLFAFCWVSGDLCGPKCPVGG